MKRSDKKIIKKTEALLAASMLVFPVTAAGNFSVPEINDAEQAALEQELDFWNDVCDLCAFEDIVDKII